MNIEGQITKKDLEEYRNSPKIKDTKKQLALESEKHIQELLKRSDLKESDLRKIAELRKAIQALQE